MVAVLEKAWEYVKGQSVEALANQAALGLLSYQLDGLNKENRDMIRSGITLCELLEEAHKLRKEVRAPKEEPLPATLRTFEVLTSKEKSPLAQPLEPEELQVQIGRIKADLNKLLEGEPGFDEKRLLELQDFFVKVTAALVYQDLTRFAEPKTFF